MKPFNLEEAKAGKKVVTRHGMEVSQITEFAVKNILYPLRGVVDKTDIQSFTLDGKYRASGEGHPFDLFMATENKTVWVNVYNSGDEFRLHHGGRLYRTKEEAENIGQWGEYKCIGTYPIEIEV